MTGKEVSLKPLTAKHTAAEGQQKRRSSKRSASRAPPGQPKERAPRSRETSKGTAAATEAEDVTYGKYGWRKYERSEEEKEAWRAEMARIIKEEWATIDFSGLVFGDWPEECVH